MADLLRSRATYTKLYGVGYLFLTFVYMAVVHYPDSYIGIVRWVTYGWFEKQDAEENSALVQHMTIAVPAVLVALALRLAKNYGYLRPAKVMIWIVRMLLATSIIDMLLGTVMAGGVSTEAAAGTQFLVTVSVVFFCLYSLSIMKSAAWPGTPRAARSTELRWMLLTAFLLVPTWSLASGINTAIQVAVLGYSKRYCIATTAAARMIGQFQNGGYSHITSLAELLGTRLYTPETGYKDTSRWYYHAILIVESDAGGRDYWNWSIGSMRFERLVRYRNYLINFYAACQPKANFFGSLRLL